MIIYLTKDQIKQYANRIGLGQRGPVIHQFNPQAVARTTEKFHGYPSIEEPIIGTRNTQPNQRKERTSVHGFVNTSASHDPPTDSRYSQSAGNLFLYH